MKKIFVFCLLSKILFAYTITLVNDSPFELTAIIQSSKGTFLGQQVLQPGEQSQWSTDLMKTNVEEIYDANASLTPFIVIWKCSYKGFYSICNNVSPGSVVTSSGCDGSKACSPKSSEDKKQSSKQD